ncbi:MAG: ComF family protein [Gammaproteobacteria bacterium]
MVDKWLSFARSRYLPARCVLCGAPGSDGRDLCAGCAADLPRLNPVLGQACSRCAAPLPPSSPGAVCGRCLRRPPPHEATVAAFRYEPPLSRLITELKFHQRLHLARLLGEELAEAVAAALALRADEAPQVIVPVPLHRARLRERGYNQALELARPVAARLDIPLAPSLCERVRATSAQTDLPAGRRRANVRGAFRANDCSGIDRVALVDDVLTTGHTVAELARVLKRAGVRRVEVWGCARAAAPG